MEEHMKMNEKTNKDRTAWAGLAKRMTERLLERQEKLNDLCPNNSLCTGDDRRQALKAVCNLNKDIAKLADEMAALEQESRVGTKAMLGKDPGTLVRTVVALMATARFSPEVGRDARSVDDIVGLVGARDPEDSLAVRSLFREDRVLHPHINISYGPTLDESGVRFKESSLNRLLSQSPDDSEKMTDAICLTNRWK
jgi:hypothetical protein